MSKFKEDLFWLIRSKDIITLKAFSLDRTLIDTNWFTNDLDSKLHEFMGSKNTYMLGTYYEALWEFLLTYHPKFKLITQNIQINDPLLKSNPTIGEMDFIYWHDPLQKMMHLEVAIKYYLKIDHCLNDNSLSCWVGPKCNDRLDLKYNKLLEHQVTLTKKDVTMKIIEPFIQKQNITAKAVLQGRLFERFNGDIHNNQNCWFSSEQFGCWFKLNESLFQVAQIFKPHWLSLDYFNNDEFDDWLTLEQIKQIVDSQKFAMPFVLKSKTKQNFQNLMIFIAPDNWPIKTAEK